MLRLVGRATADSVFLGRIPDHGVPSGLQAEAVVTRSSKEFITVVVHGDSGAFVHVRPYTSHLPVRVKFDCDTFHLVPARA